MEKQVLTIVCKINPTPEQVAKIEVTLKAFADACNYINEVVEPKITHNVTIQNQVYGEVRERFGLASNLAIRAINRVSANRKTAKRMNKPVRKFLPTSADYDARIFSFKEKDWSVSLTLVGGRERFLVDVGSYQKGKLSGFTPTSATLVKHQNDTYSVNIQVKNDAPNPQKSQGVIGVDLGRRDVAVTSEGERFSGQQITEVRDKYSKVRASLQKKASEGTRSTRRRARRCLKRLSGRERRFQSWVNHNVSKHIVGKAKQLGASIAIEDLTGIRERTNKQPRNKTERRRSNSWAFFQLRTFLDYKALGAGVEVIKINPAYTSQTCHKCLHIHPVKGKSYRIGKTFSCGHCNWKGDADFNGANVIKLLGASVNSPGGSYLSCELRRKVETLHATSLHPT
ncbi:RNA-guided endonuclease InsQ/TnpB family protein [Coleofasciculus sp. G2-EDA-02]|uniref:RNA-guided endonuclease InsQ/TnpB family protein n=1 Tax=Coleofasciculus sp. G2-EDA-02 TaxID=3069529 RepID=UPI0032F48577